jgi:hypothetical protein
MTSHSTPFLVLSGELLRGRLIAGPNHEALVGALIPDYVRAKSPSDRYRLRSEFGAEVASRAQQAVLRDGGWGAVLEQLAEEDSSGMVLGMMLAHRSMVEPTDDYGRCSPIPLVFASPFLPDVVPEDSTIIQTSTSMRLLDSLQDLGLVKVEALHERASSKEPQ